MSIAIDAAIPLVKHFEGLYLKAYRCPAGVLTIGYGNTKSVSTGDVITTAVANALLERDLAEAEADVDELVNIDLTPTEKAALISFVFNLGAHALKSSTLLRELSAGNRSNVAANFAMWNKARVGKRMVALPGLTLRRRAEAALFLTGNFSE